MKYYIKYIFLFFTISLLVSPLYAKKNKKAKTSQTKQIANKKKKSKKLNSKTVIGKNKSKKKSDTIDLNKLLNETIVTVAPTKSDSLPEKVVTIYSAFKPQLKNVAKIGFNNASAFVDTTTVALTYQVPSQNLSFQYRPIALVPRALVKDKISMLNNLANFKLGMGNYQQHFANLNFNVQDNYNNKHAFSLNNQASTGTSHPLQMFRQWGVSYIGNYEWDVNNKIETAVFYQQSQRYRYGLVPDSTNLPISNFQQDINQLGMQLGWLHLKTSNNKLIVQPMLSFDFSNAPQTAGNNFMLKIPSYYQLKNNIKLNFDIQYNISSNRTNNITQKNYFLQVDPSVSIDKWASKLIVGVSPIWSSGHSYKLYPNLYFQKQLKDTNYLLKTGWNTQITNNHYGNLIQTNPWLSPILDMKLTTLEKKYVHLDISTNKRLNYGVGIALNDYRNLVLFNKVQNSNVANSGLQYQVLFEPRAITIQIDASLHYQFSDHLYIQNTFKYIQFNSLKEHAKPWGILPMELNSNLNWLVNAKWSMNGSIQYWSGAAQTNQQNTSMTLNNAFVLNAGFNYHVAKNWSLWAKADNLLDKPYERWGYYPSLGIQILAGFNYTFRK